VIFCLFAASLLQAQSTCSLCHPRQRVELQASIHYQEGITCEHCHGGNPKALEMEEAHAGNYVGVPSRREIPRRCASCHSDPVRMRPYNLPIDQLALYQISNHGLGLAKGDERVAVCSDCHGAHDIRSARDPESRTHSRHVPDTCAGCHADEKLLARYGLSLTTVAEYRASVHGKSLLEEGNPNAPSCARCHGVHGATPPGFGDVDKVCGQCHPTARDFFVKSPHEPAMDAAGLPECASCHGNHGIGRPEGGIAATVCRDCHQAGGPPAELGEKLQALELTASEQIRRAGDMIDKAEQVPLDVEDYRARLELARTHLQEVRPAMHSLDLEQVSPLALSARSEAEDIQKEIYQKLSDIRTRRLGLVLFWFYLLLTVAILTRFQRERKVG
jgi:hypothetical protein